MSKVDPADVPVNGESTPGAHITEAMAPSIERLLAMQPADFRARLHAKLRACESPIEVLFALSVLAARDDQGHPFVLSPNEREPGLFAEGRGGVLYTQYEVRLEKKRVRLDFALITRTGKLAIELDGRAAHASEGARAADAERDQLLTIAGWMPARVTGAQVWRDIDRCSARTLAMAGIKVTHEVGVPSPASMKSSGPLKAMSPEKTRQAGAELQKALTGGTADTSKLVRPAHPRTMR